MTAAAPAVHLLCGFNGAGKTTLARELEASLPAVRFSLDDWMLRLYPGLHYESGAYGDRAENCKLLIWDTARQVLQAGTDVVLDWNQWSRRPWTPPASGIGSGLWPRTGFTRTDGGQCPAPGRDLRGAGGVGGAPDHPGF